MTPFQRIIALSWRDAKMLIRDKRLIYILLFTSILLYPILFVGMSAFQKLQNESLEEQKSLVWVRGDGWETLEKVKEPPFEVTKSSSEAAFEAREIQGIIDLNPLGAQKSITLQHRSDSGIDLKLLSDIQMWYAEVQAILREQELQKHQLTETQLTPFVLQTKDVTPIEQQKNQLVDMMPYFVLLSVLICGQVIGIDITAGEKERKTLTTLLASPHQATEIGFSKITTTTIFSAISATLTVISIYLSFRIISEMYEQQLPLVIDLNVILQLVSILIVSSILLSSCVVAISIISKSIKEANAWITPLLIAIIFLGAIFSTVDSSKFDQFLFVPIVNCIMALKCVFSHTLTAWMWTKAMGVIFLYGALSTYGVRQLFKQEKMLFR